MNDNEADVALAQLRGTFDASVSILPLLYGELTWPQKATLLRAIIEAGDHPPGFTISLDRGEMIASLGIEIGSPIAKAAHE